MYETRLPPGLREELGGALGKPQTSIRDDRTNALHIASLEVLEERTPASLSSLALSQIPRISRKP
jgi:hypothetical protein